MSGYHLVQANFTLADYPYLVVTNNGGAAPGNLIGNIDGRTADGTKLYYVVLDNTGTNAVFASKTNTLYRFVTPQGFDAVAGSGVFNFKDETLSIVDTLHDLGLHRWIPTTLSSCPMAMRWSSARRCALLT